MTLYGKSVDRPFKFRNATKKLRRRLLGEAWKTVDVKTTPYVGELPFDPIDVVSDIENLTRRFDLLRECDIDPTVLPVWEERGGDDGFVEMAELHGKGAEELRKEKEQCGRLIGSL